MKKKTRRSGIGRFLLKGLHRVQEPRHRSFQGSFQGSGQKPAFALRLSEMQIKKKVASKPEPDRKPDATHSEVVVRKVETDSPEVLEAPSRPIAEEVVQEPDQLKINFGQELLVTEPTFASAHGGSVVSVLPATPPAPQQRATEEFRNYSLSTHDILRPNDQLRLSIEAFLQDQRSPHTRRAYGKDLKRFVKYLHGRNLDQGVETLGRAVLIAYKESLLSDGLEHTTVDRHLATLRSFFRWLVDDGHISKSPADGMRFLNPKRISRTLGFTDEEVVRILALPNLHRRTGAMHYAILLILFYCGLRRSELCELRTINLGVERGQRVIRLRGKGNTERVLVMVPAVWNGLRYYFHIAGRDFTRDEYLFNPIRNNRTGVLNKPLDTSMIFYIVRTYARKAGIANRVSPHSCRATAISNARDHHVPDRAIQEFAGWASPDMITRYDKRKSAVEDSAAHAISYGAEDRRISNLPSVSEFSEPSDLTKPPEQEGKV